MAYLIYSVQLLYAIISMLRLGIDRVVEHECVVSLQYPSDAVL